MLNYSHLLINICKTIIVVVREYETQIEAKNFYRNKIFNVIL